MKRNLIAVSVAAILATAGVAAYAHGTGQHQGCTPGEGKECPAGAKGEHQQGGMQGMQGRMQGMQGNHGNMEANHARMAERHAQMAARHGGMQHGGMRQGGQTPAANDSKAGPGTEKDGEHKH